MRASARWRRVLRPRGTNPWTGLLGPQARVCAGAGRRREGRRQGSLLFLCLAPHSLKAHTKCLAGILRAGVNTQSADSQRLQTPIPVQPFLSGMRVRSPGFSAAFPFSFVQALGRWPFAVMVRCSFVTRNKAMIQNAGNCTFEIVFQSSVLVAGIILRLPLSSKTAWFPPIGRSGPWPCAPESAIGYQSCGGVYFRAEFPKL